MDDGDDRSDLGHRAAAVAARARRGAVADGGGTAARQDGEQASSNVGWDKPGRLAGARTAAPSLVHRRHMPMETLKFHIPRKNKEKRALFQYVSTESREYEDMLNILTSSYIDTGSTSCFTYSKPQLVYSEVQEKEFVEKRREMKVEGRTDKELEECYYFLSADSVKLQLICEKGLMVGHSWITALGNPNKGVYLSKYSDILQINTFTSGATGELLIFKVMKGKVKSIYCNMTRNLLDPTPRFDSHLSKNISKVTSTTSYHAFELTQQYFYEYSFDELRTRPRQVCPYAVVSFLFKGKDAQLPSKTLPLLRLNSQSAEGSKERNQFTVWSGDLVKGDRVLFQASLRSFSPPILPCRLPEKLEIGCLVNLDEVTSNFPSALFSWNLYVGSHEVVKNDRYCSLLEVVERSQTGTSVTKLLDELETRGVVLVTSLVDRGFLFLLSSAQMTTPNNVGQGWKRCLQALFIFPETRDVTKSISKCTSSTHDAPDSGSLVIPWLNCFLPVLHQALVKARANPLSQLSAGVAIQVEEYLSGQNDGKLRLYPMAEYDTKLDDRGKLFPAPKRHSVNIDSYLLSYLYNPNIYLLTTASAKQKMELLCAPKGKGHMEEKRPEGSPSGAEGGVQNQTEPQKVQQMIDLVMTCKKNAEMEVTRQVEERQEEGVEQEVRGRKRKLEQEMAEKTLKFLRTASQQAAGGGSQPELNKAATGAGGQSLSEEQEEGQTESWPFDRLASKLGLPANCDVDLRKQEELEEQTVGSVSSLEGFSPSSRSGECAPKGQSFGRRAEGEEEDNEIPWVLIPITDLCSEKNSRKERGNPQDPRCLQVATATCVVVTASPPNRSPTPSPEPSSPPSPYPSPYPSPSPSLSPGPNEDIPVNVNHSVANEKQLTSMAPWKSAGVTEETEEKSQPEEEERRNQEESPSSLPPVPQPFEELQKEESGEEIGEVTEQGGELVEEREEVEMQQKDQVGGGEEAVEVIEILDDSPPPSPRAPFRDIDGILQEHLGDLSSEFQHLLQGESIHYSPEHTSTLPSKVLMPFSQYVSMCSPSSSFQSYVGLLRHNINDILLDSNCVRLHQEVETEAALASRVSDFVAGIRAANTSVSRADNTSADCSDDTAASNGGLVDQDTLMPMSGELWRHHATSQQFSNDRTVSHTPSNVSLSVSTSASVCPSLYEPVSERLVDRPFVRSDPPVTGTASPSRPCSRASNPTQHNFWLPQQQSEFSPSKQTQGVCNPHLLYRPGGEGGSRLSDSVSEVRLQGFSGAPPPSSELLDPAHVSPGLPVAPTISCSPTVSIPGQEQEPATTATDISSVISQLHPAVFSSLVEIIKDVRRNSMQFYVHSTEQEDQVYEDIKEYLLKQRYVEQSPVAFLDQETEDRLLVVIQNKHIAEHIHKIPGLVSLKRHHSVMFVGIDSTDDLRNSSHTDLFVSGGFIVSDEFVLNPDFITHERLRALLSFLEQQSSAESVWRWRVHCKTQSKLKQQARFKRDAASILDVLTAYQKHLIVEFLPYHHCDMPNCQSPDLKCLVELQARYTRHRHIIFLTERRFEMFPNYFSSGIIIANIDDIMHNFSNLVGYHDIKKAQPTTGDLAPKDLGGRQLSHEDAALGSELSPQSFLEQSVHPPLLQPSLRLGPGTPLPPDQLVPESRATPSSSSSSCTEGQQQHHSDSDFEALRLAISQFRAERQVQQQLAEPQPEFSIDPVHSLHHDTADCASTPPVPDQARPAEKNKLTPGRKALVAKLDTIHSALDSEPGEEEEEVGGREVARRAMEQRGKAGRGEQRGGVSMTGMPCKEKEVCSSGEGRFSARPGRPDVSLLTSQDGSAMPTDISHSTYQNIGAAAVDANDCIDSVGSAHVSAVRADHRGEHSFVRMPVGATCSTTACQMAGDRERAQPPSQEQPVQRISPNTPDNSNISSTAESEPDSRHLALQHLHREQRQIQQQQPRHAALSPYGGGLLPPPSTLPLLSNQTFPHRPILGPLAALGGILGPGSVWSSPAGAALVWGLQQAGMEFPLPGLTGAYHNPGSQGSPRYRGGHRGGFQRR
ncbi:uncharacterized protein LOC130107556 isoform X2 [Lampris incognitus]|uniref:uncharacterized protein LOC130107556 isoform X2 n=1 Tax=Lampris incognitus TaxID=2546036 RepID=UPI0024B5C3FE|nr:uncharacterized protein LOC130107556 isoform X2 [Lampris incognitus]